MSAEHMPVPGAELNTCQVRWLPQWTQAEGKAGDDGSASGVDSLRKSHPSSLQHLAPDWFSSTSKSLSALLQVTDSTAPPSSEIPASSLSPKGSFFYLQAQVRLQGIKEGPD